MRTIGLSAPAAIDRDALRDALVLAGWSRDHVLIVSSDDLADRIRNLVRGGVVVHIESQRAPSWPEHITGAGIECQIGDLVVSAHSADPREWIPRAVEQILREVSDESPA
jgi:hypothetical protein